MINIINIVINIQINIINIMINKVNLVEAPHRSGSGTEPGRSPPGPHP